MNKDDIILAFVYISFGILGCTFAYLILTDSLTSSASCISTTTYTLSNGSQTISEKTIQTNSAITNYLTGKTSCP
jgi:hypothetical protein